MLTHSALQLALGADPFKDRGWGGTGGGRVSHAAWRGTGLTSVRSAGP